MARYFGTDGVRGEVGKEPITPDWIMKLAWATGMALVQEHEIKRVIIGKDTRISGYMLEAALQSGFCAAGVDVGLLGVMPTPGIAYLTRTFHASAGVVISASHNVFSDNGVKLFSAGGFKLPEALEQRIEHWLNEPLRLVPVHTLGKASRIPAAHGRYIEFCKNSISLNIALRGLKIVLDCANGATYHIAPHVFSELGAEVIVESAEPNGLNINKSCGTMHPQALQAAVLRHQADLGIAFDGDGDRVLMVDRTGYCLDGDSLLYIIAKYRAFKGEALHNMVGTQMSNYGLEQALSRMGIHLHRTPVGDRYVMEKMKEIDARVGGENSGHIICMDRNTTGDGIVAALQVLAAMIEMEQDLPELRAGLVLYPQYLRNTQVEDKQGCMNDVRVQEAIHAAESKIEGRGRVLIRPSGTEPLVRVMAEGEDQALMEEIVQEVVQVIESREVERA